MRISSFFNDDDFLGGETDIWIGLKTEEHTNSETGEKTIRLRWIDGMVSNVGNLASIL